MSMTRSVHIQAQFTAAPGTPLHALLDSQPMWNASRVAVRTDGHASSVVTYRAARGVADHTQTRVPAAVETILAPILNEDEDFIAALANGSLSYLLRVDSESQARTYWYVLTVDEDRRAFRARPTMGPHHPR